MGLRHQLFIIAKINGRYRSLACVHHQWLYGFTVLKTCRRLVKIFQCPQNAHLLKLELARASGFPPKAWEDEVEFDEPPEFPFITTCLLTGTSVDLENNYISQATAEPWNVAFYAIDNDDGITIFDLTDLNCISHCFVHFRADNYEDDKQQAGIFISKTMVPLFGSEYLSIYYKNSEQTLEMRQVADWMSDIPLIDTTVLEDIWPEGDWFSRSRNRLPPAVSNLQVNNPELGRKTLAEQAMEMTIQKLLREEHELQYDVEDLPGFTSRLRSYFNVHPHAIKDTPFGFELLQTAYRDSSNLDLHAFPFLTGEEVLVLVRNASKNLSIFDVSGNNNMHIEHFAQIPRDIHIEKLYMWAPDALSSSEVRLALQGHTIGNVYAWADFRAAFVAYKASPDIPRPTQETQDSSQSSKEATFIGLATNIMWVLSDNRSDGTSATKNQTPSPLLLFQGSTKVEGAVIPIKDTYLDSAMLTHSLAKCMYALALVDGYKLSQPHDVISGVLAFGLALRNPKSSYAIESLPAELYTLARLAYHGYPAVVVPPSKTNERTIVIVQERSKDTTFHFRVACVSVDENGILHFHDFPTVLGGDGMQQNTGTWTHLVGNMKGVEVGPCDEGTVHNLFKIVKNVHVTKVN
ncbi:uncharacterized protein K460DRAFT_356108 [Cucurbitaria berberidis CBS 394.84]|uniref:Uncharacterized protein n=1 Tax=Cucurbitaria berberidis CBS 394.84 TaxID=1168544 RepID=A0A9P4GJS4_9PLEO|nr:uncharacterized protein K460DRAFT_356108 [Cucurbitaria berberidis CBS 394.84]KAF1846431.1 hypothetical protein K460DRAFT_356108 [Cucurbitaria berberidis CBS 394.84]